MNFINKFFVTAFGVGYLPLAPGTWGSIVGALLIYAATLFDPSFTFSFTFIAVIVVVFFLGVWGSKIVEKEWGEDPSRVVIDEVIGVWIAMLFIPFSWLNLFAAFVLFRVFDIAKPFGIRKMESAGNGWGVMLDDVLAGVYANVVLNVILYILVYLEINLELIPS